MSWGLCGNHILIQLGQNWERIEDPHQVIILLWPQSVLTILIFRENDPVPFVG